METTTENKFSKEDFYQFCKMVEDATEMEFEESRITVIDEEYLSYNAYFNDQDNYKISFQISLENGQIKWEEPEFYDDELDSVKPHFEYVLEETYSNFLNTKKNIH